MTTMPTFEPSSGLGLWRALRERKRLVILVVAAFGAFGLALTALTPPVYRATVRLEFPQDGERSPWTGQAAPGGNFQMQNMALYTSAELITNRTILGNLADEIRRTEPELLARSEARREIFHRWTNTPTARAGDAAGSDPVSMETHVERLARSISVEPVAETRLVDIRVEDTDPELARVTADRLAQLFIAFQVQRAIKADTIGWSYLQAEIAVVRERIEARSAQLHAVGSTTTRRVVTRAATTTGDAASRRKELNATESRLAAARNTYREKHPKVVALAAEVEELRQQGPATSGPTSYALQQVRPGPEQSVLANELAVDEGIYQRLVASTMEIDLRRQLVVPVVSIVAPAIVGMNPVRPRPLVNLAASLGAGLLAALGLALLMNSRQRTIRGAHEAEQLLGLPVLAVIHRRA